MYINKVELQGIIGNVRVTEFEKSCVYDISLATNRSYTDKSGGGVIETTWHNIKIWKTEKTSEFEKGKWLHVKGYLKAQKYVDTSGIEHTYIYIYATEAEIINNGSN